MKILLPFLMGSLSIVASCKIDGNTSNEREKVVPPEDGGADDNSTSSTDGKFGLSGSKADNAVTRARAHIKGNKDKVSHDDDHGFEVRDVVIDKGGVEHVRFDRKFRGLRVIGGDLVVHSGTDGGLAGFTAARGGALSVDMKNLITGDVALQKARTVWKGTTEKEGSPELVVFWGEQGGVPAYEVVFTGTLSNADPSELHVFIDAHTGDTVEQWEGFQTITGSGAGFFSGTVALETTLAAGLYQLIDPTRGNQKTLNMANKSGGSGTLFTDKDNLWGNSTLSDPASIGVDAQFGAAKTWDYYLTKHTRSGIKNNSVGASSKVHYGRRYNNAYWSDSCFCMTYGDGDGTTFRPFTALDVAGHEMSHGVTSATANLNYSGESGGLNEATSDIFGTMVEFYANLATDPPDYLIGERLYINNTTGKSLRYMYKPSSDGKSPDCYSSTIGSLDVHYSSGIANHFFYLLAEGSNPTVGPASPTCNNSTLAGIGRDAAGAIWYRALTAYMTSTTKYSAARQATIAAANELFTAGSPQAAAVAAAWDAVQVQ